MGRYEVLSTDSRCYYMNSSSLLLVKSALTRDNEKGTVLVQAKFRSFYDKTVSSLVIAVTGMDVEGCVIEEKQYQYLDLDVERCGEFGDRVPVYLDHPNIRKYAIKALKVVFRDGNADVIEDGVCITVPEGAFPLDGEMKEQYIRDVRSAASVVPKTACAPERFGNFWRCSCGEINGADEAACRVCRCPVDILTGSLDKDALLDRLSEFKKQEAEKAEVKKAQTTSAMKRAVIACAAAALAAVIFLAYRNVISPSIQYGRAERYYAGGEYEKAITAMSGLGDYKDAPEKVKEYKYGQASAMLDAGDTKGAKALFKELNGYSDSKGKYNGIEKEENYNSAISKMEGGQYQDALTVFIEDPGYRDSAYYAGWIFQEMGSYEEAIKQFEKVDSSSEFYNDAAARNKVCAAAIQEKEDTEHYNNGVNFAKNGYLYSAKKEFEECGGINNSNDYLDIIGDVMGEEWLGVYYAGDEKQYLGIFCKVDTDLQTTYVAVFQNSGNENTYSGIKPQEDGTILVYDSFDDSVEVEHDSKSLNKAAFKIQKDNDVYKNKGGTTVHGSGSFGGGSYKRLIRLTKTEDGISQYNKTETGTSSALKPTVDSYNMTGEKTSESAEQTVKLNENSYEYIRIGDEKED